MGQNTDMVSNDGILAVDNKGRVINANKRFIAMWRIPKPLINAGDDNALLDFALKQLVNPDAFINKVKPLYGTDKEDICTLYLKDGRIFECFSSPLIMRGDIFGRVWSFRDITERRRIHDKLMESEQKFKSIFDNASDAIVIADIKTKKIITGNISACRMLGYNLDELSGLEIRNIHPEKKLPYAMKEFNKQVKGKLSLAFDVPFKTKEGSAIYVDTNSFYITISGKKYLAGIFRDVTRRRQADEKIRLHENRLNNLLNLHRMEKASEKEIFDFTLKAVLSSTQSEFAFVGTISGDESEMVTHSWSRKTMDQCAVRKKPIHFPVAGSGLWGEVIRQRRAVIVNDYEKSLEFKKGYPKGHIPLKRFLGIPVFSAGRIVFISAVANKAEAYDESDISALSSLSNEMWNLIERKKAEKALMESEERYRTLIENIDLSICLIDKDYKLIMANSEFCRMFGVKQNEIKERHCFEICLKGRRVCPDCAGTKAMATKKAVRIESESICADGTRLPVNIHAYPVLDSNNNAEGFIKISEDISEYKKVEKAKNNLIRDLSHGLKTPVSMIEMSLGIIKNSMDSGNKESLMKAKRIAEENIRRVRKDLNGILYEFSLDVKKRILAKNKRVSKKASLKSTIKEVTEKIRSCIESKNLKLNIRIPPNADKIKIQNQDLKTLLDNLFDNAIKFTEKGEISMVSRRRGKMVEIEIKDTGCGIPAKDIKRVFEKFYKRHAAVEGTGLGLSICKELVEMYGGEIKIFSKGVGKGTAVVVRLPKV